MAEVKLEERPSHWQDAMELLGSVRQERDDLVQELEIANARANTKAVEAESLRARVRELEGWLKAHQSLADAADKKLGIYRAALEMIARDTTGDCSTLVQIAARALGVRR
ncbi:MAG TPA: hypothetical protein VEJ18_03580 [Planctomycetota bacterium]|nr:hypothetical protein [Planctomycetota bacterium]